MLAFADKYRQMVKNATKKIMLFPQWVSQEKKSTVTLQCDIKLPSLYPFRSSQQIENNTLITHNITHQSQHQYPKVLHNQWPHSCIGLVLCEHHQNNQIFYVYGTGTLIHYNIVLTSAQNVYCRRLNTQYTNIRFIVGVNGDKCSGIYDVMRVHYSKEYYLSKNGNYDFAVLWLYDDLSECCGYVGWKTIGDIKAIEKYTEYGYVSRNQEGSFYLRQIIKNEKQQNQFCSGNGVMFKENENKYHIVGVHNLAKQGLIILNDKIRNMVNQWTHITTIDISQKNIGPQGCKIISQANWTHYTRLDLGFNKIAVQGCKYLRQTNWTYLSMINLNSNNIRAQGCKYLSQAIWTYLSMINLGQNNIGAQGCKYLKQANWKHLTQINLVNSKIGVQGCKYLSQANWKHLTMINLGSNNIYAQGSKYLSQANWIYLTQINLGRNNIDAQGCKYLTQANWAHLSQINLIYNDINTQGCKYLSQCNWSHLSYINLYGNHIKGIIYRLLFLSSQPNTKIEL